MRATRIYKALLRCYPAAFRHEYGGQMLLMFAEQLGEARRAGGPFRELALWLRSALDALTIGPLEHGHLIVQDLRYAFRSVAASPGFAAVAILSLALGIGANTAIFSLWNGLLHASLPAVDHPERLWMLTNPEATGAWNGSLPGQRNWLSFDEFEQLRTHALAFSSLAAAQSYLDTWQVRSQDGAWNDARGRLVSESFFTVLGVRPAIGRTFSEAAPEAVISHAYWQQRFGGRADVLGQTIPMRHAALTVVGVAPVGFAGETPSQQPDIWAPLRMRPLIRPGAPGLHDVPPNKLMWLHVFGRLAPGVTESQAEAQANAIFAAGIHDFYRAAPPAARDHLENQSLRIHSGERGVSPARSALSSSLTTLFAAVAILLLIACANLANLLLARGAARRPEIMLRISLGASRGRILRQLMTESVLLALAGGLASLAAAYLVRGALTILLSQADPGFRMSFGLSPLLLAVTLAVTLVTALLFGLLPAWEATRPDAGRILKEHSRPAPGPAGRMRWGKLLVSVQLALSLPLLVGAGLMARTVYNEQHVDLGFPSEGLLMAALDPDAAGYTPARRTQFLSDARDRLAHTPGIESATFSSVGLFAGVNMLLPVAAEGYTPERHSPRRPGDASSSIDLVGPSYFSTMGVPLLNGRDFQPGDDAAAPKVCVINEAFARFFFAGRDPIGMRVSVILQAGPVSYQVAGVARDARWLNLRLPLRPRMFIPWNQSPVDLNTAFLLVRAKAGTGPRRPLRVAPGSSSIRSPEAALSATRRVIQQADAALPITWVRTVEEQIAPLNALDRSLAQLAEVFGCAALLLAAIGLYGVLSYGVARRRSEIAIRVALGAQGRGVVAMMLRETAWLVAAGLAAGAGLAYAATRLIRNWLFGVAPQDPATLILAFGLLIAVALTAAYLPARRAASLDPIAALRQE